MPWFYALQNEDKMLPEITINFHPSILFILWYCQLCVFGTFSLLCLVQIQKPVLLLLKDNMQTASKTPNHRIEKAVNCRL